MERSSIGSFNNPCKDLQLKCLHITKLLAANQ
jgi:hypothetical protein